MREACADASTKIEQHVDELQARMDVHLLLRRATSGGGRVAELWLRNERRAGMELSEADRVKLVNMKHKSAELKKDMDLANNNEIEVLAVSDDSLTGCDVSWITSLPIDKNGKRLIKMITGNFVKISENAVEDDTRKAAEHAYSKHALSNEKRLVEWIQIEFEMAALLGYDSASAFHLEPTMARTVEAVDKFLKDIRTMAAPQLRSDLAKMTAMGLHPMIWNWRFAKAIAKEQLSHLDMQELRKFFPATTVVNGMLKIYERLMGFRFERVPVERAYVWAEKVIEMEVFDAKTGLLHGTLYLDLENREGKYSHAACWDLVSRICYPCGEYQPCVTAVLANFPSDGLLPFDDVVTLFHEIGHAMHNLSSEIESKQLHNVERDFVELPSQMLEHWCFERETLEVISGHCETGETLTVNEVNPQLQQQRR